MLTRRQELREEVRDDAGNVTSRASGVVRGLRAAGVLVGVVGWYDWLGDRAGWERGVEDVAVARSDRVTVAHYLAVGGMERRVVVWLAGRARDVDDGESDQQIDVQDRVFTVSRCTTHLVKVTVP